MSQPSVTGRALDLPPLYSLVALREGCDAFEHARAIADQQGAGTLVWVRRYDVAEFAVVLEPEQSLVQARLAIYAGMNALADALATHAPPAMPVTFDWPDAIRVDGALVGGARLGWPEGTVEDETPAWLVFSAIIRIAAIQAYEPGLRPLLGALDELGFEAADAGEIIASFSRHLMNAFHEWGEARFASLAGQWLERLSPRGQNIRIALNGDLLLPRMPGAETVERRSLAEALASPTWLDRGTGMPWL